MKVYVLPADIYACGHNRLIWPTNVLQATGVDVTIIPPGTDTGLMINVKENPDGSRTVVNVEVPPDADVIVLQRPAHPFQPHLVDTFRENGIAVVVDMDDDMSSIHPDNRSFQLYRPRSDSPLSWQHTLEACKRATLVTTSTAQLQKVYARHGRGMVLDNYVPEAYLQFPKQRAGTFGWAGTVVSHPNDPQVLRGAVQPLIDEGAVFQVVGDGRQVKQVMGLREEPSATGPLGLDMWARSIAENLDTGLVPLASTSFNSSKSRLKGIEYMSVGVPWVASPRTEYRRLHKESGTGFLAETPKEWYRHIKALMTDDRLYEEQSQASRHYMRDQTYQANAWRWEEAWNRAYDIQRGRA